MFAILYVIYKSNIIKDEMLNNKIRFSFVEIIFINFTLKSFKKSSFKTKNVIKFALNNFNYINVMPGKRLL